MAQPQDSIEDWMDSHEWPWQIGTRLHNIFIKLNIQTLGQLLGMDRRELLRVNNMGKKSLKVLDAVLAKDGLKMDRALRTTLGVLPDHPEQPELNANTIAKLEEFVDTRVNAHFGYNCATLRDQFAMAALTGISSRYQHDDLETWADKFSELSYQIADAMMEARKVAK